MDFDKPKVYGDTSITDGLVNSRRRWQPGVQLVAGLRQEEYEQKFSL